MNKSSLTRAWLSSHHNISHGYSVHTNSQCQPEWSYPVSFFITLGDSVRLQKENACVCRAWSIIWTGLKLKPNRATWRWFWDRRNLAPEDYRNNSFVLNHQCLAELGTRNRTIVLSAYFGFNYAVHMQGGPPPLIFHYSATYASQFNVWSWQADGTSNIYVEYYRYSM